MRHALDVDILGAECQGCQGGPSEAYGVEAVGNCLLELVPDQSAEKVESSLLVLEAYIMLRRHHHRGGYRRCHERLLRPAWEDGLHKAARAEVDLRVAAHFGATSVDVMQLLRHMESQWSKPSNCLRVSIPGDVQEEAPRHPGCLHSKLGRW